MVAEIECEQFEVGLQLFADVLPILRGTEQPVKNNEGRAFATRIKVQLHRRTLIDSCFPRNRHCECSAAMPLSAKRKEALTVERFRSMNSLSPIHRLIKNKVMFQNFKTLLIVIA